MTFMFLAGAVIWRTPRPRDKVRSPVVRQGSRAPRTVRHGVPCGMTLPLLTDRFPDALNLAHAWHANQRRKGGEVPYISHLLGVASVALEFGADEDEAIAALLHDALEDGPEYTGRNASDLRLEIVRRFGERVAQLVDGATDDAPDAGQAKAPWQDRKAAYLRHLRAADTSMLLVSASDKLHNARTILTEVLTHPESQRAAFFERFSQGQAGTVQYYRLLADAFMAAPAGQARPGLRALFRELERTVSAIEHACGLTADEARTGGPLQAE